MELEEVLNEVDERIEFGVDVLNGENGIANAIGIGCYIVYRYNHSEEEVWEWVTLDDEEKARMVAENWASFYCTDDDEWQYHKDWYFLVEQGHYSPEEYAESKKRDFDEFNKRAAWDKPIRIGQNVSRHTTVGYASVYDFITYMPLEALRQFTSRLFECSIITGFEEDH